MILALPVVQNRQHKTRDDLEERIQIASDEREVRTQEVPEDDVSDESRYQGIDQPSFLQNKEPT